MRICVPNTNFETFSQIRTPRCIKPYFSLHGVDSPNLCSEHKFYETEHKFFQTRTPRCAKPYYSLHGGHFANLCSEHKFRNIISYPRTSMHKTLFFPARGGCSEFVFRTQIATWAFSSEQARRFWHDFGM